MEYRSGRMQEYREVSESLVTYDVTQVGDADAGDHRRAAEAGGCASKMVEEPHARAKQDRRDVDTELVEEAGIQQLLDGVRAMDANIPSARGGLGLLHGALE